MLWGKYGMFWEAIAGIVLDSDMRADRLLKAKMRGCSCMPGTDMRRHFRNFELLELMGGFKVLKPQPVATYTLGLWWLLLFLVLEDVWMSSVMMQAFLTTAKRSLF